jgi:hypothetical protein
MATKTKEMCAYEAISAYGPAHSTIKGTPLSPEELDTQVGPCVVS